MGNTGVFAGIYEAFSQGGIWMWAILAVQVVAFAIIAERIIQLYLLRKTSQRKIVRKFENPIRTGNLKQITALKTMNEKFNPIYKVVKVGAQTADNMGGKEEIRAKMDEILLIENEKLDKRTGFLAMLGNVGTLLGLLGTIVGLITAFASVGQGTAAEKAVKLTEGISMAMSTTAYGLIVAIPTLVMYAVLQNRSESLKEDLHQAAFRAFNWLNFNYENIGKKPKARKTTAKA